MEKEKPAFLGKHGLKLMIVAVLAIACGSAWWLGIPEKVMAGKTTEEVAVVKTPKIYYYAMDPMVVNVSKANEYNRYLKIRPVLVTEDSHLYENLKSYSPKIRNILLSLYSKETVRSILAEDGFDRLRDKSLEQLQIASGDTPLAAIKNVMFNEYVIQ